MQLSLDKLLAATRAYNDMLGKKYMFVLGKNQKLSRYEFVFTKNSFKHTLGLNKLTDIHLSGYLSERLFDSILLGKITLEDIQKSKYYEKIENRINNSPYLENYMDNTDSLYFWDGKSARSIIVADIMMYNKSVVSPNENVYIFFIKANGKSSFALNDFSAGNIKIAVPVTLFSDAVDYRKNQSRSPAILYAEKFDKTTGEKTVLTDKLYYYMEVSPEDLHKLSGLEFKESELNNDGKAVIQLYKKDKPLFDQALSKPTSLIT